MISAGFRDGENMGRSKGGTFGSSFGAAFGGPLGSALEGGVGNALGGLMGGLFDDGPVNVQREYNFARPRQDLDYLNLLAMQQRMGSPVAPLMMQGKYKQDLQNTFGSAPFQSDWNKPTYSGFFQDQVPQNRVGQFLK